jgi:hypothetical protein
MILLNWKYAILTHMSVTVGVTHLSLTHRWHISLEPIKSKLSQQMSLDVQKDHILIFHVRSYTLIVPHVLADATRMEQHWSRSARAHSTLSASYWPYPQDQTVPASKEGSQEASTEGSLEASNECSREVLNESSPLRALGQLLPIMGSRLTGQGQRSTTMLQP